MISHITSIREKAADVRWFRLSVPGPFSYIPGQYVMLSFPGDEEKRAYSIVEYDSRKSEMLLIIRKAGYFTSKLFSAVEGQELCVAGPYGRFVLPDRDEPLVFIAGGMGITPLYCMLMHVHKTGYSKEVNLYYSAKTRDTMALYDDLASMNDRRIRMSFRFTSEEGRLSCEEIIHDVPGHMGCLFYICGSAGFNEDFRQGLLSSGIDEERIKSEDV